MEREKGGKGRGEGREFKKLADWNLQAGDPGKKLIL
jgi:hypothetical protein